MHRHKWIFVHGRKVSIHGKQVVQAIYKCAICGKTKSRVEGKRNI